ncbi:TetR/AcrR family transcriptional regulator [Cohnella suwonensis]|uniref:TetR/AcrR family transcriptional regulator n=1 Tax=Cohnella suwonensis TaxID=696072 RepID=A0ABW0M0Y6_9BACL
MNDYDNNGMNARGYIIQAFLELLAIGPFEKITVHAIVRKAGVSRSTFYLHFLDKYDLMDRLTDRITGELEGLYGGELDEERLIRMSLDSQQHTYPAAIAICEHIRAYRHFYKSRLKDNAFATKLAAILRSRLQPIYRDETHATFAAYGTVGFFDRWLDEGLKGTCAEVALRLTGVAMSTLPAYRNEDEVPNDS